LWIVTLLCDQKLIHNRMALVISTEELNRYGFRILTSGIDLQAYKKNPVLCWDHYTYGRLPIGKVENLRIDNNQLLGDPVFDEDDDFAAAAKRKFDKGMLNACSMGISVTETSTDPAYLIPGQTRGTVTRCELREVSMVVVPANRSAVKLSADQEMEDVVPVIEEKSEEMNLENIAKALGLDSAADETAILTAARNLNDRCQKAEGELNTYREKRKEELLSAAEAKGMINEDNRDQVAALADANLDAFAAMVEAAPAEKKKEETPATLSAAIKPGQKKEGDEPAGKSFEDFSDAELLHMKHEDPKRYAELAAGYKGRAFA